MSELAYNYKGEAFAIPAEAAGWRVRRLRDGQRGQLDNVVSGDGIPLVVPIGVDFAGFRDAVGGQAGRYRLDLVTEHRHPLMGADAAYVTIASPLRNATPAVQAAPVDTLDDEPGDADGEITDSPVEALPLPPPVRAVRMATPAAPTAFARPTLPPWVSPAGTWPGLPVPGHLSGAEYLVAEALRGQMMAIQVLTGALSDRTAASAAHATQMIGAAAELVRAADGAAMPMRRPPPAPPSLPPPPTPPAPSTPPPPPAPLVYALPRNAMPFAVDDEGDEAADDPDTEGAGPSEQDMFAKVLAIADKVQGVVAPMADVARLVMGGYGNAAALGIRNAGEPAPVEVVDETEAPAAHADSATALPAHLCTSHMLLIAHELGDDGSLFRRLVMAMEPTERTALTSHLCGLPFDAAVAAAAAMLTRLRARRRTRATVAANAERCAPDASTDFDADTDPPQVDATAAADPVDDEQPASGERASAAVEPREVVADAPTLPALPVSPIPAPPPMRLPPLAGEPDVPFIAPEVPPSPPVLPGAQLAMVHTSALVPITNDRRPVTPPPGLTEADVTKRLMAIGRHLTMLEMLKVQALIGATPQAERDAWVARVIGLPPAEAAVIVRAELVRRGG